MSDAIRDGWGITIKREHLRQLHIGDVDPNTTQFEDLLGLYHFYGVPTERFGPVAKQRLDTVLDLREKARRPARRRIAMYPTADLATAV